ncbi:FAD/NAD(P)-binding domain-containing protein [Daldinia caldariorum]|uniref:FAD/NAD(P)-binding domain-containing protein n=1 Tax=Daldinia caldariorum TaxID=326644 RepID=UPI00200829E6|nr:FAD/NAD(P)-binding domain-containing protein [Daldinia caldariorum]KAI1467508.1 FAD/NAD(P)-binding domain-containing protein [Daldinia caldariorum]
MVDRKFRVIVVGGGPVGLTMAHTLSKAGIEYVVLERRPTVLEEAGATLVIAPNGMRAFKQLGLYERLREISVECLAFQMCTEDGRQYNTLSVFDEFTVDFGCSSSIFNRAELIKVIYEGLSEEDQARVLTNKKVIEVTSDDQGVTVRCADGTRYDASVVVGADGVHSAVWEHMRSISLKASPKIKIDQEKPFVAEYRMLWASFPLQDGKHDGPQGLCGSSLGRDHSLQYFLGKGRGWIFVYERLPTPTREPTRYTEEDVIAVGERWGDVAVGTKLKVKDVFPRRIDAGMTNLEEGVLKRWFWERIVLVGDAAHKFTPNPGQGYMNGMEDVLTLTNILHGVLKQYHDNDEEAAASEEHVGTGPSTKVLSAAFQRYQDGRLAGAHHGCNLSGYEIRKATQRTILLWFFETWVMPCFPRWMDSLMLEIALKKSIRNGLVLDFVDGEESIKGRAAWVHPMPNQAARALASRKNQRNVVAPFLSLGGIYRMGLATSMAILIVISYLSWREYLRGSATFPVGHIKIEL